MFKFPLLEPNRCSNAPTPGKWAILFNIVFKRYTILNGDQNCAVCRQCLDVLSHASFTRTFMNLGCQVRLQSNTKKSKWHTQTPTPRSAVPYACASHASRLPHPREGKAVKCPGYAWGVGGNVEASIWPVHYATESWRKTYNVTLPELRVHVALRSR